MLNQGSVQVYDPGGSEVDKWQFKHMIRVEAKCNSNINP